MHMYNNTHIDNVYLTKAGPGCRLSAVFLRWAPLLGTSLEPGRHRDHLLGWLRLGWLKVW